MEQIKLSLRSFIQWPIWLKASFLIAFAGTALRFVFLEKSPQGFFIDEAAISAQIICIRQSLHDLYGNFLPVFSQVLGGGFTTPVQLYLGAAWTSVFGDSIASFRSLAALFGGLTVLGVFKLAMDLWKDKRIAVVCTLIVAISPWAFLHSRIAWDPSLAPALLIWSLHFLLKTTNSSRRNGAIAGVLAALAIYTYPPLRAQIVFVVPLALIALFRCLNIEKKAATQRSLFFFSVLTFVSLPLIWLTLTGQIQGRFNMLSIFNEDYLEQFGGYSIGNVTKIFFQNLASHFSPRYLFISGDENLRHSTQTFGQWGWLEIFALFCMVFLLLKRDLFRSKREGYLFGVLTLFYISAVVPASLTWESNPHALRSITAYPFIALIAGYLIVRAVDRAPSIGNILIAVAIIASGFFYADFFLKYPKRSAAWFDADIVQMADSPSGIEALESRYESLALDYYRLREGFLSCRSIAF